MPARDDGGEEYWRKVRQCIEDAHDEVIRPVHRRGPVGERAADKLREAAEAVAALMQVRGWSQ